jgi:HAD superfamily hydrolase (TIGR01509 family)
MVDSMQLGGVLIDCDGTLVDTEALWTIAERQTIERWGGRWSPELKRSLIGQSLAVSASVVAEYVCAPSGEIGAIHESLQAAYNQLMDVSDIAPRAGAKQLLHELAERSIPVAVISNSCERDVETALASAGLRQLVTHIQCLQAGLRAKPAPDLYLTACDRWRIRPRLAVAIEDTQAGLDAARAAGLFTIGIPSVAGETLRADRTLSTLWPIDLDEFAYSVRRAR